MERLSVLEVCAEEWTGTTCLPLIAGLYLGMRTFPTKQHLRVGACRSTPLDNDRGISLTRMLQLPALSLLLRRTVSETSKPSSSNALMKSFDSTFLNMCVSLQQVLTLVTACKCVYLPGVRKPSDLRYSKTFSITAFEALLTNSARQAGSRLCQQ